MGLLLHHGARHRGSVGRGHGSLWGRGTLVSWGVVVRPRRGHDVLRVHGLRGDQRGRLPWSHLLGHLRMLDGLADPLLGLLRRRGAHPGHANPRHGSVLRHGPGWSKFVGHNSLTRRTRTRHTLMALRSHRPLWPLHGARPELRIKLLGIVVASRSIVPNAHVVKMLLLLLTLLNVVA